MTSPTGPGNDHRKLRMHLSPTFWIAIALIVTAILLVQPRFESGKGESRNQMAVTEIAALQTSINTFRSDTGVYPAKIQNLLHHSIEFANWHGPYLDTERHLKDPWQHDYVYVCPGKHNSSSYDISSPGPDGQAGTDDDITNWTGK